MLETLIKNYLAGLAKKLAAKGVHPDQIAKDVAALEAKIAPLAAKFAPDVAQINALFFGGKLNIGELGTVEEVAKEVFQIEGEIVHVIAEVESLK